MKYLSIVFVAAITLVSCGGGMETACDCINAASEVDMEDSAAVAEFEAAHREACEPLLEDTAADFSECAEAAAEFGYGAEEAAEETAEEVVEEVVEEEVVEEVVDSAAVAADSVVAEVSEEAPAAE
ncbi:MAG: hypothetical protein VX119_06700 [Bacteroidota bacterium]|nr:hypothetical protein [Bacteroidota bacterium]